MGVNMEDLTLSTGVVLRTKRLSPMIVQQIRADLMRAKPKVPIVHIKEDDRDEANPNDPDYIDALKAWEAQLSDAIYDAMIVQGTEVATIPEGIPKVNSEEWIEDLALVRINVPAEGKGYRRARYLAWIRYVAAVTPNDITAIILAGQRAAGLAEVDVAKAAETFQHPEKRPANPGGVDKA